MKPTMARPDTIRKALQRTKLHRESFSKGGQAALRKVLRKSHGEGYDLTEADYLEGEAKRLNAITALLRASE